jgi:hypothetical protein
MPRTLLVKRIVISILLGLLLGAAISEITFLFLNETARAPQVVLLVIPAGTAERVARGEKPPTIPGSLSFVAGDTLTVKNEDSLDHQLGPLWIPAGTSASLELASVNSYAYACSFQPSNYIGLTVHEPLTLTTRIKGIIFTGLPLGALIALYSLVLAPRRVIIPE